MKEVPGAVSEIAIGSAAESLGQVNELRRTPAIVMFSTLEEVRLKFVALYIADCSVKGSILTKTLKFSGYLQGVAEGQDVVPPLKFEYEPPGKVVWVDS